MKSVVLNARKTISEQASLAGSINMVKFKALPGTGCVRHDGYHYSATERCCSCDTEAKRLSRKIAKDQAIAKYQLDCKMVSTILK